MTDNFVPAPRPTYDQAWTYIAAYPDLPAALAGSGLRVEEFASEHWLRHGRFEGRFNPETGPTTPYVAPAPAPVPVVETVVVEPAMLVGQPYSPQTAPPVVSAYRADDWGGDTAAYDRWAANLTAEAKLIGELSGEYLVLVGQQDDATTMLRDIDLWLQGATRWGIDAKFAELARVAPGHPVLASRDWAVAADERRPE